MIKVLLIKVGYSIGLISCYLIESRIANEMMLFSLEIVSVSIIIPHHFGCLQNVRPPDNVIYFLEKIDNEIKYNFKS